MIYHLPQNKHFCGIVDIAHFLHPAPPVVGFELFGDAASLFHAGNDGVHGVVCLFVNLQQMRAKLVQKQHLVEQCLEDFFKIWFTQHAGLTEGQIVVFGINKVGIIEVTPAGAMKPVLLIVNLIFRFK